MLGQGVFRLHGKVYKHQQTAHPCMGGFCSYMCIGCEWYGVGQFLRMYGESVGKTRPTGQTCLHVSFLGSCQVV